VTDAEALERFSRLVWDMRKAQRNYFQMRGQECLAAAKLLEGKVDKALMQMRNPQKSLFQDKDYDQGAPS
jgi:hypothetical protein